MNPIEVCDWASPVMWDECWWVGCLWMDYQLTTNPLQIGGATVLIRKLFSCSGCTLLPLSWVPWIHWFVSSSSFIAVIHGYSMNSLPSQWNSRYRGGHRCPFLTPSGNFQAFHLCFRGTSNDWHAEFQSFVMINVRCRCLCVLDFKKRQEALQEPLVVLNWWNLVNISMETFCIWSFALPIVIVWFFHVFPLWFLHVSTISSHICAVLQDTLW